jgi:hypothetical protein
MSNATNSAMRLNVSLNAPLARLSHLGENKLSTTQTAPQPFEPFVFARRHQLPIAVAREIIGRHGRRRQACELEALSWTSARNASDPFPGSPPSPGEYINKESSGTKENGYEH